MRKNGLRGLGLAAALLLPACVEADMNTEIKADGSGTMGVSMKCTEKFVEIVKKLEKIDPKQDVVKQAREGMMQKPEEKVLAEMEKRGLKFADFEAVADDKQISSRMKVEFRTVESLKALQDLGGGGKGGPGSGVYTLNRDDKGVYTLAVVMESGKDGEGEEGKEEKEPEAPKDPEAEMKKAGEAMALMGELMGEAQKFRFTVVMKVPGEVVDYSPKAAAKKEAGQVTWNFTFASMMEASMAAGEDGGNPMENFKVMFKMPEGQSIPASALSPAAPPKATPTPAPKKAEEEGMEQEGEPEDGE